METLLADDIKNPEAARPYVIASLQLCQLSYLTDPIINIPRKIGSVLPLHSGGRWSVLWGPVKDPDWANLVYVAGYSDPSGKLIAASVVIRGTDLDLWDIWGFLKQAYEDLMVWCQSPLPWLRSDPSVLVADGTLDALHTVQRLKSGNAFLADFLKGLLRSAPNKVDLMVTGHSLGGCMTTVVAPWLKHELRLAGLTPSIIPITFAAPTAGNHAFATYYTSSFAYTPQYANTLDIVPLAFWNLLGSGDIGWIYDNFNLPTPVSIQGVLGSFDLAMEATGATYRPPNVKLPLPGSFFWNYRQNWEAQASHQHSTDVYMALLGGSSVVEAEPADLLSLLPHHPRTTRKLEDTCLATRLKRPVAPA